jgi:hypothetical protein
MAEFLRHGRPGSAKRVFRQNPAIHVFAALEQVVDARVKPTAVRFDFCGQGAWR